MLRFLFRSKATLLSRNRRAQESISRSKNHGTYRSTLSGPERSSDCPAVERGRNVKVITLPYAAECAFGPAAFVACSFIDGLPALLRLADDFDLDLFRVVDQTAKALIPKFSSWSLIAANFGRLFHAMSTRYRPVVQLKRITKWVSHFQTLQTLLSLNIKILLDFYSAPPAEFRLTGSSVARISGFLCQGSDGLALASKIYFGAFMRPLDACRSCAAPSGRNGQTRGFPYRCACRPRPDSEPE